jgi:hypothetical protein
LKSIEPVRVFARVQDAYERIDPCLLADDGQDLFTDTSIIFANDRNVRVAVGERERVKENKYREMVFPPLVLEARSGDRSNTTAKIIKKHAMLAGHKTDSEPMFLYWR